MLNVCIHFFLHVQIYTCWYIVLFLKFGEMCLTGRENLQFVDGMVIFFNVSTNIKKAQRKLLS